MSGRYLPLDDRLYQYLLDHSLREHPEQTALRQVTRDHPHGGMQIAPEQGQLMALLVKLIGARQAIEVGVFTGYSALSVALALPPDGRLLACDVDPEPVRIASESWRRAGVAERIDLRIGPALETLEACLAQGESDRYDFAFIDADKTGYDAYYECCLKLVRRGGLIVFDNTLWGGSVAGTDASEDTVALRALNRKIHRDERVDMVLLPFSDGVTITRRR